MDAPGASLRDEWTAGRTAAPERRHHPWPFAVLAVPNRLYLGMVCVSRGVSRWSVTSVASVIQLIDRTGPMLCPTSCHRFFQKE